MAHAAVLAEQEEFCEAYFPIPSSLSPRKPKPVFPENGPFHEIPTSMGSEAMLRKKFAEIINKWNLIPGLVFRECSERPDPLYVDASGQTVDAAWYFERDVVDTKEQEWGNQVIPVEFELRTDPFDDNKADANMATKERKLARGRCITYSELLHAIQQRTALFMLVVVGQRVRFTRWDRSGTVVTRALDYVTNWRLFCDILWRIGHCSEAQLGFDPTAARVYRNDPDYVTMINAATMENTVDHSERVLEDGKLPEGEFTYVRDMFKDSLKEKWPCYRVKVPDGENIREFLIGKPVFRAEGMAGRGTRGYVALDCATKRFVWLKDAWRANYELVAREGDILQALNEANVYNVPTMVCHGDIVSQATETPDWWERKKEVREKERKKARKKVRKGTRQGPTASASSSTGSSDTCIDSSSSAGLKRKLGNDGDTVTEPVTENEYGTLRLHQHYRLVVQEVAMRLDDFQHPQQLVAIIFDSVYSHFEAATKPKEPLLHRDISSGNILIYPRVISKSAGGTELQWRGMLADWEMSKPVHRGDGPRNARQPERTGTLQYLSVALLSPGPIRIGIPDELESFFHVLLYYALRYVKSANSDGLEISNFLDTYFDVYSVKDGVYNCGAVKRTTIQTGHIQVGGGTYLRFGNPLDSLFDNLLSWFRARYAVLAYDSQHPPEAPAGDGADSLRAVSYHDDVRLQAFATQWATSQPFPEIRPILEAPTAKEHALAKRLEVHSWMLQLLFEVMCKPWPSQVAADQIPSGGKSSEGFPTSPSRKVDSVRKRMALEVASEPPLPRQLVASEPPLPGQRVAFRLPHTPQKRAANSLGALGKSP